jgi:hypothetical protein
MTSDTIDPDALVMCRDFATAYGVATWCYVQRKPNGWLMEPAQEVAETSRLARKAVSLGKHDAIALSRAGHCACVVMCDFESGVVFVERARMRNPNLPFAWFASASNWMLRGDPGKVVRDFTRHAPEPA